MSIPKLEPSLPHADGEAAAHTELIARLAKEYLAGSPSAWEPGQGTVPAPSAVAPVPGGSRDIALAGGFPATQSSGPPPVHPTVVGADLPVEPRPESGAADGKAESHEFGEPSFYFKNLGSSGPSVSPRQNGSKLASPGWELPATPGWHAPAPESLSLPGAGTQLAFLEGIPAVVSGNPAFGIPQPVAAPSFGRFDIDRVRRDFPALHQRINGRPLIWLDNAATTHKPQTVLDATARFYGRDNSNIHRAAHTLAARSTELFEAGREKVRRFLGAADARDIVFVRGTTEAINLVAQSYGRQNIGEGDEILLSGLEHHANIVPWQILAQQVGATIRVIPLNDRGELILEALPGLLNERTKILAVTHVSNALGTINPVEQIIALAHARGVPVLVDGAQSAPHLPIQVQAMDADFFVFSGHKIFGPTGIGALYGKSHLLEAMPPWQGGGHMIRDVTFEKTVYQHPPEKFEAGTPDIAGVIGLGAAIDYLTGIGIPAIAAYEHSLLEYATEALAGVRGIRPIGTARHKASVFGFVIPGVESARIAQHLDQQGIAVRAGHHCAQPAVRHFGVETTLRPSLAFYNTTQEVDAFVRALDAFSRSSAR